MTHVITSLCLRDNGCSSVCPVESINPGNPAQGWYTYYIDPSSCIDCGACVPECPFHAIYPADEIPQAYKAKGGELINMAGLNGHYEGMSHTGEVIRLDSTRALTAGEVMDLTPAIALNEKFYK
ncbi:MAG TPA: 4Fe-4S binding protein [Anaerolineales bacterium]|nr:4Fe-4S binding protein [Anaerolineales bacterium]